MLSRRKGDKVERYVEKYLTQQKLRLVERNFSSRYGEIDLIMEDGDTLVFIEVRFRANTNHGSGAETVDYRKQQKIIKTAQFFLQQQKKYQQLNCRFDVVSVTLGHKSLSADWLKNAFQLSGW
ncbi:YraN family protein [Kangiella shandongensis]|uniref:YraN family protein n=1 Tax=Kangiella shandongensis TaxID=2763258 RepID=UPI001CBF173F|nr:YraN family protein [Kangiella shandongensis]